MRIRKRCKLTHERKWRNWQTHSLEVAALARAWGVKFPLPHQHIFCPVNRGARRPEPHQLALLQSVGRASFSLGTAQISRLLCGKACQRVQRLRLRRTAPRSRNLRHGSYCLPLRLTASAFRIPDFAAQCLTRRFPQSTLQWPRTTWGWNDSLDLSRVEPSSTISCQLWLKHYPDKPESQI